MGSRLDRRAYPRLTCCVPKATRMGAVASGQTGGCQVCSAHAHTPHTPTHTHHTPHCPRIVSPKMHPGALGQVSPEEPEGFLERVTWGLRAPPWEDTGEDKGPRFLHACSLSAFDNGAPGQRSLLRPAHPSVLGALCHTPSWHAGTCIHVHPCAHTYTHTHTLSLPHVTPQKPLHQPHGEELDSG